MSQNTEVSFIQTDVSPHRRGRLHSHLCKGGVLKSAGVFVGSVNKNTVAAYFFCAGLSRFFAENKDLFQNIILLCVFSYFAPSVQLAHKDSLTILFTFTPSSPSQSAPRAKKNPTLCKNAYRL